jgi:hypothetical protein
VVLVSWQQRVCDLGVSDELRVVVIRHLEGALTAHPFLEASHRRIVDPEHRVCHICATKAEARLVFEVSPGYA